MALELNTENEYIRLDGQEIPYHREFFGANRLKMPEFVESGRILMPLFYVLDRRSKEGLPDEVRSAWDNNYFHTADTLHRFKDGSGKLVLDDPVLRRITPETQLSSGAAVLPDEDYEALEGKNVMSLSPERIKEIHGKDYTAEEAKQSPELRFLARGEDRLSQAVDQIFPGIKRKTGSDKGMAIYFDTSQDYHTMRALYVVRLGFRSLVSGRFSLGDDVGRLVGLAPEALSALDLGNLYVKPFTPGQLREVVAELERVQRTVRPELLQKTSALVDVLKS